MNVLEAIRKAQEDDVCIRRASWPEGQLLVWKDWSFFINKPQEDKYEAHCPWFTYEAVVAEDWEMC